MNDEDLIVFYDSIPGKLNLPCHLSGHLMQTFQTASPKALNLEPFSEYLVWSFHGEHFNLIVSTNELTCVSVNLIILLQHLRGTILIVTLNALVKQPSL